MIYFLFFIIGFIIAIFLLILRMHESSKNLAKILLWVFRFIPAFCLSYGLMGISNREMFAILDGDYIPKSHFSMGLVGADMYYLFIKLIIF